MGLYNTAGTRLTRSSITTSADPDPMLTVTQDVWEKVPLPHELGAASGEFARTEGEQRKLKWKAGATIRTSELDRLFPASTITSVTPATGGTAGGTVVTIRGAYLDGVTAVTFGGTAGTNLVVVSPAELRVTVPARAAGAVAVAGAGPGGPFTRAAAFTYA